MRRFLLVTCFLSYIFYAEGKPMSESLNKNDKPTRSIQAYTPPSFKDNDRLAKIQALFPEIHEMYQKHAEKEGYPGDMPMESY